MPARKDPVLTGDRFTIELDGGATMFLAGFSFPSATIEPAGRAAKARYGPAVLRRSLSSDKLFSDWWKLALTGNPSAAKNGKVSLLGTDLRVAAVWKFTGAVPTMLTFSTLDASTASVVMETLELTVQSFERDS